LGGLFQSECQIGNAGPTEPHFSQFNKQEVHFSLADSQNGGESRDAQQHLLFDYRLEIYASDINPREVFLF
jgi:hypothetical protein